MPEPKTKVDMRSEVPVGFRDCVYVGKVQGVALYWSPPSEHFPGRVLCMFLKPEDSRRVGRLYGNPVSSVWSFVRLENGALNISGWTGVPHEDRTIGASRTYGQAAHPEVMARIHALFAERGNN